MAYIQKRKTKDGETHFRVQVRLKGHPTQTATFRRKTDAKTWATVTEAAIRERRHFPKTGRRTVGETVARYIAEVAPEPGDRTHPVPRILRWWDERLGALRLADLSSAVISQARSDLAAGDSISGKPLGPATRNRYMEILSHVCTKAKEWGWLDKNPVRELRMEREPPGRVRYLSEEELTRLLAEAQKSQDERLYPLMLVALSTGARQDELLSLRWGDIDLDRRVAVLQKTKNRERRALPLHGKGLEIMSERLKVRRSDTDLVFWPLKGSPPAVGRMSAPFPIYAWQKARRDAQIDDFRWHDLRHTAASYLAMSGAMLHELAHVLGHKTLSMVKRYAHLTEQHTHGVVSRMNARYLGLPAVTGTSMLPPAPPLAGPPTAVAVGDDRPESHGCSTGERSRSPAECPKKPILRHLIPPDYRGGRCQDGESTQSRIQES